MRALAAHQFGKLPVDAVMPLAYAAGGEQSVEDGPVVLLGGS
ncbi:hypothetical protein [Streptomyces sp. NPDC058664]